MQKLKSIFISDNKVRWIRLTLISSFLLVLIALGGWYLSSSTPVDHDSKLNPKMSAFFDQYSIYYTGWDNYLLNGKDLGLAQTGSSSVQAFNLAFSKNSTSTATEAVIKEKIAKGQTEGRFLNVTPDGSYVIEEYAPDISNDYGGSLTPTILHFRGNTYVRDVLYSDYFVDQDHIIYIGCLKKDYDEKLHGNKCNKYGLYLDNILIDQTLKSISDKYEIIDLNKVHNHTIYYWKGTGAGDQTFFSYNISDGVSKSLTSGDGFNCELLGFIRDLPVTGCVDIPSLGEKTDIFVGNVQKYVISSAYGSAAYKVVNNHFYYTEFDQTQKHSQGQIKISLIKDGLKVADAGVASSDDLSRSVFPIDGSHNGCLFANDESTAAFCIIGENIVSRSNLGFDQNEYYINGKLLDFDPYYNAVLSANDPRWDSKKPMVWQLGILPDSSGKVAKVVIKELSVNNVYVSDLLSNNTISKPQLLISNLGSIVGMSLK